MKIVVAHNTMAPIGGAQLVTEVLVNELANLNHEVYLLTNKINPAYNFQKGISIHKLSNFSTDSFMYWLYIPLMKLKTKKILKKIKPDLVISTNFPMNNFVLNTCDKLIFYCHEPFPFFYFSRYVTKKERLRRLFIFILKILYKKLDLEAGRKSKYIVANSFFTKSLVKMVYEREDVIVIYPPLSIPIEKKPISKQFLSSFFNFTKSKRIMVVSPSSPIKGFQYIPTIFEKLYKLDKNKKFLIIITGTIHPSFCESLKKLEKLRNCDVINLGYISRSELFWLYENCGYCLYLSEKEPFGLVPVEAFFNGCIPITIDDNAGPSETIKDGINGYLVNKNNLETEISNILFYEKKPKEIYGSAKSISEHKKFLPLEFVNQILKIISLNNSEKETKDLHEVNY